MVYANIVSSRCALTDQGSTTLTILDQYDAPLLDWAQWLIRQRSTLLSNLNHANKIDWNSNTTDSRILDFWYHTHDIWYSIIIQKLNYNNYIYNLNL